MSCKIISTKQNYEIYNQKLLIIIQIFKFWRHYLENNTKTIEIWSNHNNFRKFIKQKKLNIKQIRWALTLTAFDFEIFYRSNKTNPTNKSSKRFDYKKISSNKITLLSTLQNKLTLSIIGNLSISLTQNEQKNSYVENFLPLILTSNVVVILNKTLPSNIKKQLYINLASIFQLTNIAIIISKKNVKTLPKKPYKSSMKSMKFLIQKFQTNNI